MRLSQLRYYLFIACTVLSAGVFAQDALADNMLVYQRSIGGWPKAVNEVKVDYTKTLSELDKAGLIGDKSRKDATIDNNATIKEIRYLLKAYKQTTNKEYLKAAENGIRYLLVMQQPSGGFPQYFPDSSSYRAQITFNDNAMINALNVLWDAAYSTNGFDVIDQKLVTPAMSAVNKGIDCILKTQVKVNGKLTSWCAQHDRKTLQPTKARAFELISLSGMETVGIIKFLMKIENPSQEIKTAIQSAVAWLDAVKIVGYKYEDILDKTQSSGRDRIITPDASSVIWARFYDINTNKPFFSGRDSQKKWTVAEIENERRVGYAWYGAWPADLLAKEYPKWKAKNGIT